MFLPATHKHTYIHLMPGVGLDEERVLEFTNVTITPKPLIVPGDLFINFDMEVRGSLPESIQVRSSVLTLI